MAALLLGADAPGVTDPAVYSQAGLARPGRALHQGGQKKTTEPGRVVEKDMASANSCRRERARREWRRAVADDRTRRIRHGLTATLWGWGSPERCVGWRKVDSRN